MRELPKMNNRTETLKNTVSLFSRLIEVIKPPPRLSISEWAEQNRVLSSEEAAAPGRWQNAVVPYAVEIMNAISDTTVREVVMMTSAQAAKTNILLNVVGYHIHLDPCPLMIVQPTIELGESFGSKRLTPMLRDTPCLQGKVPDEKSRQPGNTIREKIFPGGYITVAGANSAPSLKGRPIRIILFDEVDEAPENLAGQGDPVKLAQIRSTGFPNKKMVLASTPTIKGHSRIETAYTNSSREHWTHRCPSCGEWSAFSWRRLVFENLMMTCPFCGSLHTRREWLNGGGRWIADNPESDVRGFHVTAMDAPTLTWQELVNEWVEAKRLSDGGNHSALITFINTRLAETWALPGEVIETHALENKREVYNAEVPDGVCVITMGVDVQTNRLAYGVWGWGLGFENWLLEYGELWGDPRQGEVWNRLDELLARAWRYTSGGSLKISRTAVDSGDGNMSLLIYTYCKARETRGVYAVKGQNGDKIPMTRRGKSKYSNNLIMVGVDGIKADLTSWLKAGKPGDGLAHFPIGKEGESVRGCDSVFFDMLTAEKRVFVQNKKGYGSYSWEKVRARNEALDVYVYARAALRLISNRDDLYLKRQHIAAPWLANRSAAPQSNPPDIPSAQPVNVRPKKVMNNKRSNQSNRNSAQQGIIF